MRHRKTTVSEQGRATKVKKVKEKRADAEYALESIREWLRAEQLRSILISMK